MILITGSDINSMTLALTQVGSWVEVPITVFEFSSVAYTGTTIEAGDPPNVTYGTRSDTARFDNVSFRDIERMDGRYQADDKKITMRGSYSKDDAIVSSTGTYNMVDGPWKLYIGSSLLWEGIGRKVQS